VVDQIERFGAACRDLERHDVHPRHRHVACSAGLLRYPDSVFDLVRIGIASYGFWPSEELRATSLRDDRDDPLRRVLSWKSVMLSVNEVGEGEYISYGTSFLTSRRSRIGVVPVGYGYGFSRTLSNRGHVLVHGKRAPVVGTVNMNMIVVDVTDVEGTTVGDEVVLIGRQGDLEITVSSFSDMNNSLNYELLARLPDHIPRQVVD
jgi:alanine racemase